MLGLGNYSMTHYLCFTFMFKVLTLGELCLFFVCYLKQFYYVQDYENLHFIGTQNHPILKANLCF